MVREKKDLFFNKLYVGVGPDEHWYWDGDTRDDGYGYFEMNHDKEHTRIGAHRASYILFKDSNLSPDDVILHLCDERYCVNPKHLQAGSPQENMTDMVDKERSAAGEDSGQSKLTEKQVEDIRSAFGKGKTLDELADQYNMAKSTLSYIVNFKTWNR